jgi:glycine oxidase
MPPPSRVGIVVIGAGALGLAVAAELAGRGAAPLVLDAADGSNASAVAAGMIAPAFEAAQEDAALDRAVLYRMSRDLWPDLGTRTGVALIRDGAEWIGPREPLAARFAALGFETSMTSEGFHTPEDWRLEPRAALARLADAVTDAGGEVRRARVLAVAASGGEVRIDTDLGEVRAEAVVVAAGWAAATLSVPGLAAVLAAVTPIKGQILKLEGAGAAAVRRTTRGAGVYLTPRRDGVLVGASMQSGRTDLDIESEVIAGLRSAAERICPELSGARIAETWAGVRGAVADGLPLAGASALAGVHLALAPRRNGWLLAPLIARSVAASVLGGDDPAGGVFAPGRIA